MEKSEENLYKKNVSKETSQFLVSLGLAVAAFLMVAGWILHLKYKDTLNWGWAFAMSLFFAFLEYIFNTTCTRYGDFKGVFTPGQMATLSIIFGCFFTFVIDKVFFYEENDWVKEIIGLILIAIGTSLVLWDKKKFK